LSEITAAITTIAAITRKSAKLIHIGDSTHTHGQVMLPVSFRPINNTVSRPGKPIPLEEDEELLDIISASKGGRGDFNNFGEFAIIVLIHIIAYPLAVTKDIGKLFAVIGEQILYKVSIKARRANFSTSRIICWFFIFIPTSAHVTTINQFCNFLTIIIVSLQNTTQPFRITIPVVIHREHRTVLEF
jgi:hypothetical protein